MRMRIVTAAALIWPLAFWSGFFAARVAAHDWYPTECCSGRDCFKLSEEQVREDDTGWTIVPSGQHIAKGKERQSRDGYYHMCSFDSRPSSPAICFFVPGFGV